MEENARARHYRWEDLPKESVTDTISRRIITGERVMVTHVYLEEGAVVPTHSHDNEQITYILEGSLRFWLGEDGAEVVDVGPREVLHIPSGLPHRAQALAPTLDVDIFAPPRRDWLEGTDTYFHDEG